MPQLTAPLANLRVAYCDIGVPDIFSAFTNSNIGYGYLVKLDMLGIIGRRLYASA